MNCQELEAKLADYLGGELDAAGRQAVAAHLAGCDACRREVDELAGTVSQMQRLDTVDARRAAEATSGLRVVRERPLILRLAWTAVRAAAFIGIGLLLGRAMAPSAFDPPGDSSPIRVVEHTARDNVDMNPKWRDRAASVRAGRSSFARDLALIAPAGPG
jgi:anti-sigma factor RsiW